MADRQAAPQADAARHADTIRAGIADGYNEDGTDYACSAETRCGSCVGCEAEAALDALVAAVAAAEQDRDEYITIAEREAARADRLETALRGIAHPTLTTSKMDMAKAAFAALASPAPDRAEAAWGPDHPSYDEMGQ